MHASQVCFPSTNSVYEVSNSKLLTIDFVHLQNKKQDVLLYEGDIIYIKNNSVGK